MFRKTMFSIFALLLIVPIIFLSGCSAEVSGTPTHEQSDGEFRLYISIQNTNVQLGQDFNVEVTFKNLSGRIINFTRSFDLVEIRVPNFYEDYPPMIGISDSFAIDETRVYTKSIGSRLTRGVHEVFAIAGFTADGENHTVFSNTIFVTVR